MTSESKMYEIPNSFKSPQILQNLPDLLCHLQGTWFATASKQVSERLPCKEKIYFAKEHPGRVSCRALNGTNFL